MGDINWGWYTVYLLMIILNVILCKIHGFEAFSWQEILGEDYDVYIYELEE